ncbi:MAG TPA: LptA/OstA family protein [Rhodospirillales bacterium]|nr:LptA/OstA family protein [Rhodospirillales bacterium]
MTRARPRPRRAHASSRAWARIAACCAFCICAPALAQGLGFGGGDSDAPIEVDAADGIEWLQDQQVFTARGDAVAVRGDVSVHADLLRAYYRNKPDGGTEVWRLDAGGNVRIVAPEETAYGDNGVFDVENGVLVLSGPKVRLVTAEDEIIADRQIEYWEKKRMAVARGNAHAIRGERRLRADVLSAHFRPFEGKTRVYKVEAFDNVYVVLEDDTVTADRAIYNVESGIATLTGSVKITRGENQLNGCVAEIDLGSGASTLKGCEGAGKGEGRVRGLIVPDQVRKK